MRIRMLALFALLAAPGTTFANCEFHLVPGEVVRAAWTGFHGHLAVYQPAGPAPPRGYPVILWYHGYGSAPNVQLPGAITRGQLFLLVGMDYGSREFHDSLHPALLDDEVQRARDVINALEECLPVDRDAILVGGFSQGGYATSLIGERTLDDIAGMMILAAGRTRGPVGLPAGNVLHGFPIFLGAGDKDRVHAERAEASAMLYRQHGADVTFERWPRMDHGESWRWYQNTKAPNRTRVPRQWLNSVLDRAETLAAPGTSR